MRFIIENPNNEVIHATLDFFKSVFGAYRVGNTKISHIDFMTHENNAAFYTIKLNREERLIVLDIRTKHQLAQVLAFESLDMKFDEIKQFLEIQNAI
jgi:hypothetical protein